MSEVAVDQESNPSVDVGKAARQGGAWAIIGYAFSKLTGFGSSIVLARVLMPEQYGLMGMVNAVAAMIQVLGASGIGAAVIHQRDDIDEYANTAWWIDIFCGIGLFVLTNLIAPLAVLYYHEPRVRALLLVVSINFMIGPLGATMDVLLRRDLRFKIPAKIGLVQGFVVAVLTIILALLGAGVWSFVYPHIVGGLVVVVLLWRSCKFRPRRKVQWALGRKLWLFGRNMFGSGIFHYINQNADYLIIGGLMTGRLLGLYVFAFSLGTWIVSNISWTISNVLFPTMASVQSDRDRAKGMFLKLIRMIAAVGFPIVCIEWAIAPLFVGTIYGAKWLPAVTAFRLIALYGMGRAVCGPALTLVSALGRPDINFKAAAATSPVLVTALYIGSHYGINGVAGATALVHGLFVFMYIVVPFRVLGWSPLDALRAVFSPLCSALLAGALTALVYSAAGGGTSSLPLLVSMLGVGFGSYVLFNLVLFRKANSDMIGMLARTFTEVTGRR